LPEVALDDLGGAQEAGPPKRGLRSCLVAGRAVATAPLREVSRPPRAVWRSRSRTRFADRRWTAQVSGLPFVWARYRVPEAQRDLAEASRAARRRACRRPGARRQPRWSPDPAYHS